MEFGVVTETLANLETTTRRNEVKAQLAHLLRQTPPSLVPPAYLRLV